MLHRPLLSILACAALLTTGCGDSESSDPGAATSNSGADTDNGAQDTGGSGGQDAGADTSNADTSPDTTADTATQDTAAATDTAMTQDTATPPEDTGIEPDAPAEDTGIEPDAPAEEEYACTLVIGYSQVGLRAGGWFMTNGTFESIVDDTRWELKWNGGGGVDLWHDADYEGWDQPIESACETNPDAPDRVLLSVSGPHGEDHDAWVTDIEATVDQIQAQYPSVQRIILQAVVGGPDDGLCEFEGESIRASWQHPYIDAAIATVVERQPSDLLVEGLSPEVRTCDDYRDSRGHLTRQAGAALGRIIATYYAR